MILTLLSIIISTATAFFSLKSKSWDETKKGIIKFTHTGWILFILLVAATTVTLITTIISENEKQKALTAIKDVKGSVYSDLDQNCKEIVIPYYVFFKTHSHILDTIKTLNPDACLLLSKLSVTQLDSIFKYKLTSFQADSFYKSDSIAVKKLYNISSRLQSYIDAEDFYSIEKIRKNQYPFDFAIFRDKGLNYDLFRTSEQIKRDNETFFKQLYELWKSCLKHKEN